MVDSFELKECDRSKASCACNYANNNAQDSWFRYQKAPKPTSSQFEVEVLRLGSHQSIPVWAENDGDEGYNLSHQAATHAQP